MFAATRGTASRRPEALPRGDQRHCLVKALRASRLYIGCESKNRGDQSYCPDSRQGTRRVTGRHVPRQTRATAFTLSVPLGESLLVRQSTISPCAPISDISLCANQRYRKARPPRHRFVSTEARPPRHRVTPAARNKSRRFQSLNSSIGGQRSCAINHHTCATNHRGTCPQVSA